MNTTNYKSSLIPIILILCSAVVFYLFTLFSISLSSWFSWTEDWISELAGHIGDPLIWTARGVPSLLYNAGLIIAGLLGMLYVVSIKNHRMFSTNQGKYVFLLLLLEMFGLCCLGLIPITLGKLHTVVSIGFFSLIPIALCSISYNSKAIVGSLWWWTINFCSASALIAVVLFLLLPHLTAFSKGFAELVIISSIYLVFLLLSLHSLLSDIQKSGKRFTKIHHRYIT